MGFTTGTASKNNANLRFRFRYNGADIGWAQPYKINDFSNSGEAVDGKFRISDLDVQFVDINGSYFANQFGRGTVGFGSSLEVYAYLGGTYEFASSGVNMQKPTWLGSVGANVATIHSGNIYNISFQDRILRLRSKNKLAVLSSLRLQFPVDTGVLDPVKYTENEFFVGGNAYQSYRGSAFYNFQNNYTAWDCCGFFINDTADSSVYPAMAGRTLGTTSPSFVWLGTDAGGTNFYDNHTHLKFSATYYGTLIGTIESNKDAINYGYVDKDQADRSKINATTYYINKTKFRSFGTLDGAHFYLVSPFSLGGDPCTVFQSMMTGAMVSPLFSSSDLDTTTISSSAQTLAYSFYQQAFYPDSYENPVDSIKSIVETTQALFSVNTNNKFELRAYGPKNLTASIPAFGTSNIISSSFTNDESDFYNRFIIKYDFDGNETYRGLKEERSLTWNKSYDAPLTIKSKWIKNPNEASILAQRLKSRYARTFPHVTVETNLSALGYDLGTIISVTDPNSGISNKALQIVGFQKKWQDRTISFDCWDAEAIYQRRGYAFWENDGFPVTGSETSSAIWGNTYGTINTTIYGSQFSWW